MDSSVNLNKPAFKVFPQAASNIRKTCCSACGKPVQAREFKDSLSLREYHISGLCQRCQDEVFGDT